MPRLISRTQVIAFLGFSFAVVLGNLAHAETLAEAVERCSGEKNSLKRLVCFDGIAMKVNGFSEGGQVLSSKPKQPLVVPVTPEPSAPVAKKTTSQKVEDFGKNQSQVYIEGDSLVAEVAAIKKLATKRLRVTLVDGQIWEQTDNEKRGLPKSGQTIKISKGALGVYYMSIEGKKRRVKVKRIK